MLDAIIWGLIQGLTEFLPVSSSGHLVLIPALTGRQGPDLATSAMLHLGTLGAVLVYYRSDVAALVSFNRRARNLTAIILIGTVPAGALGFFFAGQIEDLISEPENVALMLVVTGLLLLAASQFRPSNRRSEELGVLDGLIIGFSQALALIPGISRSGVTISTGIARGMGSKESARFAFLLGIPAIAGAGLLQGYELLRASEPIPSTVWIGVVVAGLSGYMAIAVLIRLLGRVGLAPFGLYCVTFGALASYLL